MKTEFLVQLDGAGTDGDEKILIVGATNRPQVREIYVHCTPRQKVKRHTGKQTGTEQFKVTKINK